MDKVIPRRLIYFQAYSKIFANLIKKRKKCFKQEKISVLDFFHKHLIKGGHTGTLITLGNKFTLGNCRVK